MRPSLSRAIYARGASGASGESIRVNEDVLAIDLVVELMEAALGLLLRRDIELPLKLPDALRGYQAHANPPALSFVRSTQTQGPFPPPTLLGFTGTTALSDSRPNHRP